MICQLISFAHFSLFFTIFWIGQNFSFMGLWSLDVCLFKKSFLLICHLSLNFGNNGFHCKWILIHRWSNIRIFLIQLVIYVLFCFEFSKILKCYKDIPFILLQCSFMWFWVLFYSVFLYMGNLCFYAYLINLTPCIE